MLRKKSFKILSVLVAVIITCSFLIIPVSAVSSDSFGYTFNIQQPVANSNSGYIEFITENWGPMLIYFNASYQLKTDNSVNANDGAFNFYATIVNNQLQIRNQGSIYFFDENGYLCPLTVFGFCMTSGGWAQWSSSSTTSNSDGTVNYFPFAFYLGNAGDILYARGYNINLNSLGVSSEFPPFIYGSDVTLYNQMQTIEELLRQNLSGNQAIINNANQNASNIQSNADKNASEIQQNNDKNTDKVVSGWEQKDEIDTTVTDDYSVKDKELMDSTEQGRSSAVSVFNSFGSLFQSDGHLYKGLLAVSAVFTEFMKIDWLSSLLNFSLAIGIFAFVIGTGSHIFRSAHENYKSHKIDKIDSSD